MASYVTCIASAARQGFLLLLVATVIVPISCIRLRDPAPIAHRTHPVELQRYIAYAGPFDLHQGQIARSLHMMQGIPNSKTASPLRIPELLAIYRVQVDLVTMENGNQSTMRVVPHEDAYLRRQALSRPLGRRDNCDTAPAKQSQQEILYQSAFNPGLLASRQSILIAGGAESLATPYLFPYPYAFAATGAVCELDDMLAFEDQWIVEVHVINTKNMSSSTQALCADCPCTLEDRKANSMINGEAVLEGMCNSQLERENNTACAFETYIGGLHCCVEGEFCLERDALTIQPEKDAVNSLTTESSLGKDPAAESPAASTPPAAPISSFYIQYTIEYASALNANRWLYVATCCDATGGLEKAGNLEYDVPACQGAGDDGYEMECVHTLTTYQRVDSGDMGNPVWDPKRTKVVPKPLKAGKSKNSTSPLSPPTLNADLDPDREVDFVFAIAHQHHGGLGIRIYRNDSNELLCASLPQYDTSPDTGDSGHPRLIGMQTCVFDPPQRLRASDILRIEALYNSSEARIGVQSLMYLAIHDVNKKDREQHQNLIDDAELDPERKFRSAEADVMGDLNQLLVLAGFVASTLAGCGLLIATLKQQQTRGLAKINHSNSSGTMRRCSTTETSSSSSDTDAPESPLAISSPC